MAKKKDAKKETTKAQFPCANNDHVFMSMTSPICVCGAVTRDGELVQDPDGEPVVEEMTATATVESDGEKKVSVDIPLFPEVSFDPYVEATAKKIAILDDELLARKKHRDLLAQQLQAYLRGHFPKGYFRKQFNVYVERKEKLCVQIESEG